MLMQGSSNSASGSGMPSGACPLEAHKLNVEILQKAIEACKVEHVSAPL